MRIESKHREMIPHLKRVSFFVCRGMINQLYVNTAFNKFKEGYVYFDNNTKNFSLVCLNRNFYGSNISKSNE